jgi:hypothetical protein
MAAGFFVAASLQASAIDCPSPKKIYWLKWTSERLEKGAFFVRGKVEQALPVSGFEGGVGKALLLLKIEEVWPTRLKGHLPREGQQIYVTFDVWIDGSGENYIFGEDSISNWPNKDSNDLWILYNPETKMKAFGLDFPAYYSSQCDLMSLPRTKEFSDFLSGLDSSEASSDRNSP